jgi:hypothetical protein
MCAYLRVREQCLSFRCFICRDKIKLESFRSEKDKVVRDKSFKIPEDKETETAKKRKIEKSTPTEVGSKGSLDYRVVALTVRGPHVGMFATVLCGQLLGEPLN